MNDQKYSIEHDRFDHKAAMRIFDEIKEYRLAAKSLKEVTETGFEAIVDSFYALFKAIPELKSQSAMQPEWKINHSVINTLIDMDEYHELRDKTMGDPVGAAFAVVDMEPTLEVIFDKLDAAAKQAKALEEKMIELAELMSKMEDESLSDEEREEIEFRVSELEKAIQTETETLEEELDTQRIEVKDLLTEAVRETNKKNEIMDSFFAWGLNQGTLTKMDPTKRLELAEKLANPKFKEMAKYIGRMQSIAISSQSQRETHFPEEIHDIERGDLIQFMLPSEYLSLTDDLMELDWIRRYGEADLQQHALKGIEFIGSGSIIFLEDGSDSMTWSNAHLIAKAVGIALLRLAIEQKREFKAIQFGGPGNYILYDFDTSGQVLALDVYSNKGVLKGSYSGIEAVVEYADKCMKAAGTDFRTPIEAGIELLKEEYDLTGKVSGDMIFLTDGKANVSQEFLNAVASEKDRLGFDILGIGIGPLTRPEPMRTICGGKVIDVNDLNENSIADFKSIFKEI